MGVQVVFEACKMARDRTTRLACIGGVPYSPFKANIPLPGFHRLIRRGTSAASHVGPQISPFLKAATGNPALFWLLCQVHFVRPAANKEVFVSMARGVASHDQEIYLQTLSELGRHDATDILTGLDLPVLFLGGGRDYMIRASTIRRVARQIPRGRAEILPRCSHFITIEQPERVNELLRAFLA